MLNQQLVADGVWVLPRPLFHLWCASWLGPTREASDSTIGQACGTYGTMTGYTIFGSIIAATVAVVLVFAVPPILRFFLPVMNAPERNMWALLTTIGGSIVSGIFWPAVLALFPLVTVLTIGLSARMMMVKVHQQRIAKRNRVKALVSSVDHDLDPAQRFDLELANTRRK
jgi:hypothetical protein